MKKFSPFWFIVKLYVLSLAFFSIFRVILLTNERNHIHSIPENEQFTIIAKALWMGVRFDIVITGYLVVIPAFFTLLFYQLNAINQTFSRIISIFLISLFSISLLISGIDIAYFHHFFSRFTVAGFKWADNTSFMMKMIFQEFDFWWVIFPISIGIYCFVLLFNKWVITSLKNSEKIEFSFQTRSYSIIGSILILALIFIGIRGRLESKSPIRVGTAYFSNYAFANQLGLNPVFTLMRSYFDHAKQQSEQVQLLDEKLALENTKSFLNRKGNKSSPIANPITTDSIYTNLPNIVLVLMESMSAAKMERFGNTDNLTPFLDSIASQGYSFDNFYSAGTHTYNGIFSTLFSFPALFTKHPMKDVEIPKYYGIASVLKEKNYSTAYFTTHDDQFDNVGGFLKENDYELIISEKDYPSEKVKSTLGVPDDYLFEFAIPKLNELYNMKKPFFAAMMTASDHGPYVIPDYFSPNQTEKKKQIVEYADWSLKKLIELAKKQPWFSNTLFVFVADHGAFMDAKYDVPLSYNHVPFIIYAPDLLKTPQSFSNLGGQIDIFPTLMGLLNLPYTNFTLGENLLTHKRPFMYFCNDDKLAAINEEFLFVYRKNSTSSLYKLSDENAIDCIQKYKELSDSMKIYAFSQVQTAEYLIRNRMLKSK